MKYGEAIMACKTTNKSEVSVKPSFLERFYVELTSCRFTFVAFFFGLESFLKPATDVIKNLCSIIFIHHIVEVSEKSL